jgi:hypothetical protein
LSGLFIIVIWDSELPETTASSDLQYRLSESKKLTRTAVLGQGRQLRRTCWAREPHTAPITRVRENKFSCVTLYGLSLRG